VHKVQDYEYQGIGNRYIVGGQLDGDDDQVYDEEDCVAGNDPPVDAGALLCEEVEPALDDELRECGLLDDGGYADVRNAEEDGIHDDEALGRRIREGQQRRVDGVRREHALGLDDIDRRVDVVLRHQGDAVEEVENRENVD
jgi:hypothetical protein